MNSPESGLVRALGVRGLAAHVVNITVGGGIFVAPALVAGRIGAAAPLAYLVCAGAIALVVLCFAEAGSRVALTGGPYAYVETALGPFAGFIGGALLWLTATIAMSAVAAAFAGSVNVLVPGMGEGIARAMLLFVVLGALAVVNVRGVRQGSRLIELVTVLKLLPLLLLVVVGAFSLSPGRLALRAVPSADEVGAASVLLIFIFAGVESALVPSGEVRDPARTVPRALFIALAVITVLYVAVQAVALGILGGELAQHPDAPLAEVGRVLLGRAGWILLLAGAAVSMFGYISGMMLSIPRALFAFGRDHFLPARVASVHPRFHTPHVAIGLQAVIVLALAVSSRFEPLAIASNILLLIVYLLCCVAAWRLQRRGVQAGGVPYRVPGGAVVPWAAVAVILFLLWSIASESPRMLLLPAGVVAAAAAIYVIARPRRIRVPAALR